MARKPLDTSFLCRDEEIGFGLTKSHVCGGIAFVYSTLDKLDSTLIGAGSPRMTRLVELANLSSILGNLLATGIVKAAAGVFNRAGPHKYQDLRAINEKLHANIEIKVSLETNNPKGHLAKEGKYLGATRLANAGMSFGFGKCASAIWARPILTSAIPRATRARLPLSMPRGCPN
jgi:hypothetical protein